jgi:hypothetical protein
MGRTLDLPSVIELASCKYKRVYFYFENEMKVLLMANVHGGNLQHPDTEAIKGRTLNVHSWAIKIIVNRRF